MDKENRFKEALDDIPVPSEKLDMILDDLFKTEKKRARFPLRRIIKSSIAVAIFAICTISSAYLSPAFANFMTQIPVIGQAFDRFTLQEDYFQSYKEISTDIGLIESSNNIELIIEQAFYDGNTMTLSFILQTPKIFGNSLGFEKFPTVEGIMQSGSSEVEYIEGVGYVGIITVTHMSHLKDTVNVVWKPKVIFSDTENIKGDWKFSFSLNAIDGLPISINQQVTQEGVTVKLIDAIKTDVNLSITYLQEIDPSIISDELSLEAELYAIDNLGNEYEVPYNGGTGTEDGVSREDITWNATIHGLDPEASSITFYPFAHLSTLDYAKRIDFDSMEIDLK